MIDASDCQDHLDAVRQHAEKDGTLPELDRRLAYLDSYANGEGCIYDKAEGKDTRCKLFREPPLSFYFVMECRESPTSAWERWFSGGLIHHGKTWGIHT